MSLLISWVSAVEGSPLSGVLHQVLTLSAKKMKEAASLKAKGCTLAATSYCAFALGYLIDFRNNLHF